MTDFSAFLSAHDMKLTEISRKFNIPYRTLQHWKAGTRECPVYVLQMMEEIIRLEEDKD